MQDLQGLRDCKSKPLTIQPIWDRLDQAVIVTDRALAAPGPVIRYVNPAFTRLTGYRADEVIGRSPRMLQCAHTDKAVSAAIKRDLLNGEFARGTLVNRRKDGSEYLCSLVIAPLIGPNGETEHFICVAEDLKEDRAPLKVPRLSAELEQRHSGADETDANLQLASSNEELHRLRAAYADKLQLLASASHDLRQPVMSMGLFLDVLRSRLGDAERPVLGGLLAAHLSIRTLLDGMLDTARLDAGVLAPAIGPVSMGGMLDVITGEFTIQAEMRGLRFRVVPCTVAVLSDAQLLERILRNLLANALKYTSCGSILLGCRRRHDMQGRPCVRIEVWDTGPGIDEHSQGVIFEEFRQLDNRNRDPRRGVGLGLAIVARLAGQLGHEIRLRSWPERGSVFSVLVPLAPKADGRRHKARGGRRGRGDAGDSGAD